MRPRRYVFGLFKTENELFCNWNFEMGLPSRFTDQSQKGVGHPDVQAKVNVENEHSEEGDHPDGLFKMGKIT